MQCLTRVVFINLPTTMGRDRGQLAIFARALALFPDNDRGIWPENETTCAHAYNIRKWRPSQQTATTVL